MTLLLSACDQPETTSKITSLEQRVKALEDGNAAFWKAAVESEKQVNGRLGFLTQQAMKQLAKEKTATIDPNSKGYAVLDTGRGSLLIACDSAEPYLDGHRVSLRIGNPLYMRFSGFKLKFKFGHKAPEIPTKENTKQDDLAKPFEKWQKDYDTWKASLRTSDQSYTDDLLPGTWNTVQATLPQTKPEDIGYIEVEIETDRISLTKP